MADETGASLLPAVCRRNTPTNLNTNSNSESDKINGRVYQKDLEEAYQQILHCHKNIVMVSAGAAGKKITDETSRLLNLWTNIAPLKNGLESNYVMLALLLQKSSKTSKKKEHLKVLERRQIMGRREYHQTCEQKINLQKRFPLKKTLKSI